MPFGVCHQSACATRQSAASCSAAVAGIRVSGYRAGHRRSRSGVPGRSIGGAEPVGPVFHPNNGEAHRCRRPVDLERVSVRNTMGIGQTVGYPWPAGGHPYARPQPRRKRCPNTRSTGRCPNSRLEVFVSLPNTGARRDVADDQQATGPYSEGSIVRNAQLTPTSAHESAARNSNNLATGILGIDWRAYAR